MREHFYDQPLPSIPLTHQSHSNLTVAPVAWFLSARSSEHKINLTISPMTLQLALQSIALKQVSVQHLTAMNNPLNALVQPRSGVLRMSETKHVNNSFISSPANNETEIFCTYITYVGSYLFYKYYSIRAMNSSNVFPKLRKDIFKIKMKQRT